MAPVTKTRKSNRYRAFALTIAAAGASLATPALAQTCKEFSWRQLEPANTPPFAVASPLIYDTARQRTVVVTQPDGGDIIQTWEWDGTNWLLVASGDTPNLGRSGCAGVYDSARGVVLIYAGPGETWSWDGTHWELLSTVGPGQRFGPGMAFDSARGVVVLFDGATQRDTWEWDGDVWTLVDNPDPNDPEAIAPMRRYNASMWYDPVRRRCVLCAGSGEIRFNDTWFWDGQSWERYTESAYSPARWGASATFDSARGVGVLHGGASSRIGDDWLRDTWEFGPDGWRQVSSQGPFTHQAGFAFDAARNQCVLLVDAFPVGHTWVWQGETIHGGPSITTQPADQHAQFGSTAVFSVVAAGEGTITYQWRRNEVPLTDAGDISGSRTPVLTIAHVSAADEGTYDVVVTNPCDSVTSEPARLTVTPCPAEFNDDGVLNSQDFFDFLTAFFASDPRADIDASGVVDSADLFAYLESFFTSCA